jgi:hypothetical protein
MYTEETKRRGSTVDHEVIGDTLDDVFEAIKRVIGAYHPLGYGTAVVRMSYVATPNGMRWEALVRRSSSCD